VKLSLPTLALLMALSAIAAHSQQDLSLGALARQIRAEKKSEPKPALIITNDNLPSPKPNEAVSTLSISLEPEIVASVKSTATAETPASKKEDNEAKPKESDSGDDNVKTQDYWQSKFRAARIDVARAKEQEQLSDDELNLLQIREVRELDPMAKDDLSAQVQAKQSEVDVNRAATDAAQKALEELTKEFESSGAPEDWSKTD
jgi:hypothetical protein